MKIIKPIAITDTILTATDVPETDYTNWATATGYVIGDQRQITTPNIHTVYECTQAHTSDATNKPSVDVDAETGIGTYWVRLAATNTWAMFSDQISDQTVQATAITITITPGEVYNAMAFFNTSGTSVLVEVDDPTDGIVYSSTTLLIDDAGVDNWYDYYFSPIIRRSDFALIDLPPYSGADINVTISNTGGDAKCGLLTFGYQYDLGVAENGTTISITDYSRKERDTYGRPVIITRGFSKKASYQVLVQTPRIDFVQKLLSTLTTTPVTWVGSVDYGSTIIYGYYKDFTIAFRDPITSPCSIDVEGLT